MALLQPRKVSWPHLVLESALIVGSVVLGFVISEWGRSQTDRRLAEQAIETIRREIVANQQQLEQSVAHNESERARLQADPDGPAVSLRPVILLNSAWQTAQATGATVHLDYEIAETASEIAEVQAFYRQVQLIVGEQLFALVASPEGQVEAERRRLFTSIQDNILGLERMLLGRYEEALEMLGSE